jgi:hypothetical protein
VKGLFQLFLFQTINEFMARTLFSYTADSNLSPNNSLASDELCAHV